MAEQARRSGFRLAAISLSVLTLQSEKSHTSPQSSPLPPLYLELKLPISTCEGPRGAMYIMSFGLVVLLISFGSFSLG